MRERIGRAASCAFTGHRPAALPWGTREDDPRCFALKARLNKFLRQAYTEGYRHFICGMARGADFYFCEGVIELRREFPDIVLEAAVPFPGQSRRWNREDQARYRKLLAQCDLETLIQQLHSPTCMHRRNHYMVDHASRLIAVYNGQPRTSGTLSTIQYALHQGLQVDILEV